MIRGFIVSKSSRHYANGREAAFPFSGNIYLSWVMTALWFYWENPWKVLLQNRLSFEIFPRTMAQERGTILWSRSLIKLGSEKRDVITMRGNWLSFTWSIPSHCILTWYPLHFFIHSGLQWGSYSSCGKALCICCLTCSPGKFSKLGAFELYCSYLAQVEGLPHHFVLLEVLSSFRSELPFVLKGVCFAVRFLRETGWWWPWLPRHLSCTSCGPQGMCKFIPKSYDSAWVNCSPFLLAGAEEAAEDRALSFFKIFFPSCAHWCFFFCCFTLLSYVFLLISLWLWLVQTLFFSFIISLY